MEAVLADVTSGDDARAESATRVLAAAGEAGRQCLLELSRSPHVDHRWWAMRGLAESDSASAQDLIPLLEDTDAGIRAAAALALCQHPSEASIPALLSALQADSLTADLAGKALATIGVPAVEPLLTYLEQAHSQGRVLAMRALAELADHRSIPTMLRATDDDSALVQYWARCGLERLGLDMIFMQP